MARRSTRNPGWRVRGPGPSGTARETSVVTRRLFEQARTRVLAVGFAVHQGRTVFRELAQRHDEIETLKVTLCLDVRRPPSNTSIDTLLVQGFARNFLDNEWPGKRAPEMFCDPRSLAASETTRSALHAKCIVVDGRKALVTSVNFTEAAQEWNIELGLLVSSAGRVGGGIAAPRPSQSRACAIDALGSSPDRFAQEALMLPRLFGYPLLFRVRVGGTQSVLQRFPSVVLYR